MIFALVTLALICPQEREAAGAEAVRLARAGQPQAALGRFDAIAACEPGNADARVWIGRLQRQLGALARAEAALRHAEAMAPMDVDALTELATVLILTARHEQAGRFLDRAERLSPEDPAMLATRARSFSLNGRYRQAATFYERAARIVPADRDIRAALARVRRLSSHRLEVSLEHADYRAGGTVDLVDASINLRRSDQLRFSGRAQGQRRGVGDEARAGAGVEWQATPAWRLQTSVLLNPRASQIPRLDAVAEIARAGATFDVTIGARHLSYARASVWVLAPSFSISTGDRTAVVLRSFTAFGAGEQTRAIHQTGGIEVRRSLTEKVWIHAGYANGYVRFEALPDQQLHSPRTNTWSGAARWDATHSHSVVIGVEREGRAPAAGLTRVSLAAVHRF